MRTTFLTLALREAGMSALDHILVISLITAPNPEQVDEMCVMACCIVQYGFLICV